jgi:nicotinamidase-related amidase
MQPVDASMPLPPGGFPAEFSEWAPEIAALNADVIITKRQWGAFHGTELDLQLRRRGINTIVLGGIATNFGVESTAREAWQHNYAVIIAEDACTSMSAEMHQFSIENILPRLARVRSTNEILEALPAF